MSGTRPRRVEMAAPAKLNLGLEVIGRREDGFHDIATIFLAIDLYDHLTLTEDDELRLDCDDPALGKGENLALRALVALRAETGYGGGARIELRKRIPAAAGLGGASSDAAAALVATRDLWGLATGDGTLRQIAERLGSDVPFFLGGGCAVGRGRGEILESVPLPSAIWFVVVVPSHTLVRKTARLYALLGPDDFSDGSRIAEQAARLSQRLAPDPALLGNPFTRPLYALAPRVSELPEIMRGAGAATVALSGAGPAHYTVVSDLAHARQIAARLVARLGQRCRIVLAKPAPPRPTTEGPL